MSEEILVELTVNGRKSAAWVKPRTTLLHYLRDERTLQTRRPGFAAGPSSFRG